MHVEQNQDRIFLRNPITHQAHRAQFFWQILFPLLLFLILVGAGAVFVAIAPPERASKWADSSLILMILLGMIGAAIFAVVVFALVYGMRLLLKFLPSRFFLLQEFFHRVERRVALISDLVVEPILGFQSSLEGARTLGRKLTGK
jgi:hypothetical protein